MSGSIRPLRSRGCVIAGEFWWPPVSVCIELDQISCSPARWRRQPLVPHSIALKQNAVARLEAGDAHFQQRTPGGGRGKPVVSVAPRGIDIVRRRRGGSAKQRQNDCQSRHLTLISSHLGFTTITRSVHERCLRSGPWHSVFCVNRTSSTHGLGITISVSLDLDAVAAIASTTITAQALALKFRNFINCCGWLLRTKN